MLTEKDIQDIREISPEQKPIENQQVSDLSVFYNQFIQLMKNSITALQLGVLNKDAYK